VPGHRVAVTGIGLRTPAGHRLRDVLDVLHAGKSTAATVPELVAAHCPVTFACTVPAFDPAPYCPPREQRQMERPALLALAAALDAVAQSGLDPAADPDAVGVAVGSGVGALAAAERVLAPYLDGSGQLAAMTVPRLMASSPADRSRLRLGARGPSLTYAAACASGAVAIGESMAKIRSGELTAVVAGGVDCGVSPGVMTSFARMRTLSERNDDPAAASRPFDDGRDGFVMGEGAVVVILEELEFALRRGAEPLAELIGYAATSDMYHYVAPHPEGEGNTRAMRKALQRAGIQPQELDYLNAHGTSTKVGDLAETKGIKAVFGEHARRLPVSSTKSVHAHLLGAAGAMEAAACVLTIRRGVIPPTINLENPDPDCDLDYVPNQARRARVEIAASNSFGFGGHNSTLVLRRMDLN
jgi:3-oxoacyl-[acyl-carrier-protein] synthase II